MFIEHGKHVITQLLVEARGLKTERAEDHMVTASPAGFLFGGIEELRADPLPSE